MVRARTQGGVATDAVGYFDSQLKKGGARNLVKGATHVYEPSQGTVGRSIYTLKSSRKKGY